MTYDVALMPEQHEDSDLLAQGAKFVFSEAGTGKTLTALEGVRKLEAKRGLVVAPTNAVMMWEDWLTNWTGARVQRVKTGSDKLDFAADWFVMSSGMAYKNIGAAVRQHLAAEQATSGGNSVGIIDEAHDLKTATTKRTKAVYGPVLDGRGGLLGSVTHPMILTGTPIMRHNDDLFPHLKFCYPDVLKAIGLNTLTAFRNEFTVQQMRKFHPRQQPQLTVVASRNNAKLQDILYNECGTIRRMFNDMEASLPELTTRTVFTPIGKLTEDLNAYTMEAILLALAKEDPIVMEAWQELGLAKAASSVEYIAAQDHAVLVGVWHTELGNILEHELLKRKKRVARVTGAVTSQRREQIRLDFNAGKYDVLVGQMRAMNTSWNLQEHGRHVIMAEDHWSPTIIEQFYKRVYRLGQRHNTQLDFLKSDHPIDRALVFSRTRKEVSHKEVLR